MSDINVSEARIILHFDIHQPVELMDLTLSFESLAKQYRSFLMERARLSGKKIKDGNIKLYITKIENNCILAELASATEILGAVFSIANQTNIFIDFVKNINQTINYLRNLSFKKNINLDEVTENKSKYENLSDFLDIIVKNKGGNLRLGVAEFSQEDNNLKQHVKFTFTSEEAHEAKIGALKALQALDQTQDAQYKNVLMYFYQANIDNSKADGRTSEKAIIKAIYPKELPVFFISEIDRERIRSYKDNPEKNIFQESYRVDVNVEKDRVGTPKFYRVMRLHEIMYSETMPTEGDNKQLHLVDN